MMSLIVKIVCNSSEKSKVTYTGHEELASFPLNVVDSFTNLGHTSTEAGRDNDDDIHLEARVKGHKSTKFSFSWDSCLMDLYPSLYCNVLRPHYRLPTNN